ncbi:MAG TPA: hypothetical protein VF737_07530 [Gemmatimonadaceae bacterium]
MVVFWAEAVERAAKHVRNAAVIKCRDMVNASFDGTILGETPVDQSGARFQYAMHFLPSVRPDV